MIKSLRSIRPALFFGMALVLIVLSGCSAAGSQVLSQDSPVPEAEVESLELKPAVGGNASQATHSDPAVSDLQAPSNELQPLAVPVQEQAVVEQPLETAAEAPGDTATEPAVEAQPQAEAPAFEGPLPPVDPTVGNLAPDFSLGTLAGQPLSLADLRGKAVVLNYWVTWCVPCREEMPDIEALYQEYQDEGLVVLSVNGTKQDSMADIEQFLGEVQVSFPVLLDHSEEVYNRYRILFMPTTFFIDERGVIQDIVLGSTDAAGFRSRVEQLVNALN